MKSAICVIAKNENNYIREWVEYNKAIGFDNIILYDNNDIDGEVFDDVIGDYIKEGFVIYRDVRGKKNYHQTSYQLCYGEFGNSYDWIAFFDVDEFIEIDESKYHMVNDFFSDKMFSNAECIRISWKYFDDNDLITVENGNYNVRERFTRSVECPQNKETKGILRGGLKNIVINQTECGPHIIGCGVSMAVNCLGEKVENSTFVNGKIWENAWLCHYRYKTIEEYLTHKRKRGWAVNGTSRNEVLNRYLTIASFWSINKKTKEKEEYLENFLSKEPINIIANDCVGGEVYKLYEKRYSNPFIWSVLTIKDFTTLYGEYGNIDFKNYEYQETPNYFFPWYMSSIRVDDKFSIYYPHYQHLSKYDKPTVTAMGSQRNLAYKDMPKYLSDLYDRRIKRMNDNPVFVYSQENRNSDEELVRLLETPSKYKLIFITSDDKYAKYANDRIKIIIKPQNEVLQETQASWIKEFYNDFIQ